jgi:HTH-type transcriptional regulator/antitoxin HipB
MAQGKRISADISSKALEAIKAMGAAAKDARTAAGQGQAAAAAGLGVHVQTIGRIEAGEPGVAVGHVLGLLALYGVNVPVQQPGGEAPASNDLAPLPLTAAGRYRHYKGGEYEVLDVVRHSETLEPMVLYRALYGERGLWVRPHAMFFESVEVDGVRRPRFAPVS